MAKELSLLDACKAYNAGKPVKVTARYLYQDDTRSGHGDKASQPSRERKPARETSGTPTRDPENISQLFTVSTSRFYRSCVEPATYMCKSCHTPSIHSVWIKNQPGPSEPKIGSQSAYTQGKERFIYMRP